ncbi:MAG: alpha/beta hydrolase [Pseudomonadota bacterium]
MRIWRCTITSDRRRATGAVLLSLWLAGCTDLFFVPMRQQVFKPEQLGVEATDTWLQAGDGTRLFSWHLPAPEARGVVCYFHGNAENISTHIVNVAWLPAAGYEVLLVDYRGYGASHGEAEFPEVLADVQAGLDWCLARGRETGRPAFALGQSLGAALLLEVAARPPYRESLGGVIADSGFSGYRQIARDALSHSWLTVPLKYPLSLLVTAQHDPAAAVRDMAPLPLFVLHSPEDRVVPYAHGERIFAAANAPKCFRKTAGPHNAAFRDPGNRAALLAFMASARSAGGPQCDAAIPAAGAAAATP